MNCTFWILINPARIVLHFTLEWALLKYIDPGRGDF